MSKIMILGSSNAIASAAHENTHMAVVGDQRTILIDCANSPIPRLERAGLDPNSVTDLILTHFHPDHVGGVPLLLLDMWLMGRQTPLDIYGLDHTLERIEALMGFYGWSKWPDFFPVKFHRLPLREREKVLETSDMRLLCSPVHHLVPTIGLRIEFTRSDRTAAYSCDTEPCAEVIRLAEGADLLIHEAAGRTQGHSSAEQAGEIARQAEVSRLCLIHYPTGKQATGDPASEARRKFQGEVFLAEDFMVLDME
jgi:ribonuclease Z